MKNKLKKLLGERLSRFIGGMSYAEKLFAILFTMAGLLFVFIVPPFQNPDEPMHFYRSYQLTKGQLFADSNNEKLYGGQIPLSMRVLVIDSEIEHNFDFDHRFTVDYNKLLQHHYGGTKVFEGFPNTAIYTPFAYFPSMIAHLVTATFNGPLLVALYLGRIFSLLTVLVAVLISIRVIPFGKWVIFAVGLLPMTVASAVSMSADAMTIASSLLLISTTLYVAFSSRKVSKWWFVSLSILAITMGLVKQAHVALLPILLLIPLFNKHYRFKKAYFLLAGTFLIAFLLFFIWYKKTDQITINFHPLIDPVLQKSYVLHEPWNFLSVLFQTFFTNHATGFMIGIFGNFGWLTAQLPIIFIIISVLTLYWSVRVSGGEDKVAKRLPVTDKRRFLIASSGLFVIITVFIAAALYAYWTPYKYPYIMGIQGRYFLPILPLLLLPLISFGGDKSQTLRRFMIGGVVLVLAAGIITTYGRFYVPVPVI